ncbi:PREDICTED: uncharacterized protein MAL13P1.304 [Ceratosolen solmsi marchali]|uniref:Uncharacterized protein MAL13P1.304 n=1 Tax=Ceratosolen solmsi marchali TaxID=326594 RepID=A0AAJ6YCG8_9HYME|nr:PREDICTED: uncharacterized protein MAL13P1.304 [Ceratosolen solmsi marchali]
MSRFLSSLRNLASVAANTSSSSSKSEEGQDTRMKFSLMPQRGESGFRQWVDAMKMVAKLQGGIPGEFRRKLWLTLAERHLQQRGVDWKQAEKLCFNEWCNPDDNELGIQIIKDLHRTGCSLFCGTAGRDNQAVLRRVLLGFARWNKSVGYCQGLNVLAALILQVVDRDESAAVKVMIYLIEGVLPEGYFADSLKGLSIDMAVFRDLLHMHLPKLSKHLECLQNNNTKDNATGSAYEPPLTNVFTMQWFLTLFCHCLPPDTVLCVWDLIFLEGDDVLLRTALAIWKVLSDRIMTVTSANEFYSIMGVLTREMYEFTDTNHLVKTIVSMGTLHEVQSLRENHRYNTILWTKRTNNNDNTDTEINEKLAITTAATIFSIPKNRKLDRHSSQKVISNDRERLALDISMLKQQYSKLREHQRQAHIILTNACTQHSTVPIPNPTQAMNHLLIGKNALTSAKNRSIGPSSDSTLAHAKITALYSKPRNQNLKDRQQLGITINWKDMKKNKKEYQTSNPVEISTTNTSTQNLIDRELSEATLPLTNTMMKWSSDIVRGGTALDSDSDSTSTELCDEPDRLSDVDSEELKSTSECFINVKTNVEEERSPALNNENSIIEQKQNIRSSSPCTKERNPTSTEILEFVEYQGIQEPNMKQYSKIGTPIQAFDTLKFNSFKEKFNSKVLSKDNSFNNSLKQYSCIENKDYSKIINDEIVMKEKVCNLDKNKFKDKLQEIDIFSSLLGNKLNHSNSFEQPHDSSLNGNNEILQLCTKSYERSSVNLEKEFPHTILSSSLEDFTNTVKKQSCNALEDLQFIEDEIDPNIVTKNSSFIMEDLKNSFSKQIIGVPGIRISAKGCKTYIIEPKFNINDNSNSILKSITYSSSIGNNHDNNQGELKFGVWTKVKPRKSNDIRHRRSDRALKIIQENSAILQKILTCQTNKCLPDLEEVSKSITISPINEEISKIFSPILGKRGLNEDKINLKELDRNTVTASEFDAKIDDELSKLSLIDDDEFDYLTDVDISSDYLVARDAFIDYQINEELAKLLANYEEVSSIKFQKDSTNLNTIDDKSILPNMSSYKFANESLNNKNDHSLNDPVHSFIYSDNPLSYRPCDEYLTSLNVLTTNDIDIYSQFDKVNDTSYIQHLPAVNTEINCQDNIIPITSCLFDIEESSNIDDATLIMEKSNYNISHKKIPYNITCSSSISQTSKNDYKSKISQKKKLNNAYLTQAYDQKNYVDLDGFENSTFELASKNTVVLPTLNYECEYEKHLSSKENLKRHTRDHHNEDLHVMKKSTAQNIDLKFSSIETDNTEFDNTACYYSNTQVINSTIKYESNDDKRLSLISTIKTNNYKSNYQINGYDISSLENSSVYNENDNRSKQSYNNRTLESKSQISASLTNMPTSINHHQDIHVVLPHYHYSACKKVINNTYATIPACFKNSSTKTSTTVTTITTPTSQITYSNTFMDKSLKNSTLTLTNFEENKLIIDDDTKSNLGENLSSETCIINPISLKTSPRKPEELTLKLETHSSTK